MEKQNESIIVSESENNIRGHDRKDHKTPLGHEIHEMFWLNENGFFHRQD